MGRSLLRCHVGLTPILILGLAAGHTPERRILASPRALLLYGGPLAAPVLIQTRVATSLFLGALVPDTTSAPPDRIRGGGTSGTVSIAVFWSAHAFGLPEDTLPAAAFHPLEADQHGRLYPASGGAPALLVLDAGSGFPGARRHMTARAARMLADRGAPVTLLLP